MSDIPHASPIRLLVVDDQMIVRQALRSLLGTYPNIEIIGEASNGEEAIDKAGKFHPSVIVMDIAMPKMDGIAATRLIKTNYPDIAVVGLTGETHGYQRHAMLHAGAFDVIAKGAAVEELYGAIQRAVASIQPILILEDPPISSDKSSSESDDANTPTVPEVPPVTESET